VHPNQWYGNPNVPANRNGSRGYYVPEDLSPTTSDDEEAVVSDTANERLNVSDYEDICQPQTDSHGSAHRGAKRKRMDPAYVKPCKRRNRPCGVQQTNILKNLQRFLEDQRYGDMRLVVQGREIICHYVILAASSTYFEALLDSRMKESLEKKIEIQGFDFNVVQLIVDFAYGKTISIDIENAEEILAGADYFQMASLRRDCERFLQRNLDASNCLRLIMFASLRNLDKLEKAARRFSMKHFFKISQTEEFLNLPENQLVQYLKDDHLFVEREEHVFDAVYRWLKKNGDPAANYCSALSCVRFTYLTSPFLYNVVHNSKLFKGHAGALAIFQEASKLHALGAGNAKRATTFMTRPRISTGICNVIVMVGGICSNSRLVETDCFGYNYGLLGIQPWSALSSISTPHGAMHSYSVCEFDNNIYITGGHSNEGSTVDEVSVYLSNINQWNSLSRMLHARERHGSAALDGCLYVAGGLLASQKNKRKPGVLELVERYRPSYNRWETVKPLLKRCYSPGVIAYKEMLYVIGGVSIEESGTTVKTVLNCVQRYDPLEDCWEIRPLGRPLARLSCCQYRDHFYMISNNSEWIHRYNPESCTIEEWMEIPGQKVEFAGLEVYNDQLIISGGQTDNVTLNTMITISFETKQVVQTGQLSRSRCMHGCVVIKKFG